MVPQMLVNLATGLFLWVGFQVVRLRVFVWGVVIQSHSFGTCWPEASVLYSLNLQSGAWDSDPNRHTSIVLLLRTHYPSPGAQPGFFKGGGTQLGPPTSQNISVQVFYSENIYKLTYHTISNSWINLMFPASPSPSVAVLQKCFFLTKEAA